MSDGHLNKCKECTKKDASKRREDNIDLVRHYDRNRKNYVERSVKCSAAFKEKYHTDAEYKGKVLSQKQRWAEGNPKKRAAHYKVSNAIRDGKLIKRPCVKCGEVKVQAHHEDYDKPLEVVWLCTKCHGEAHKLY